MTPAMLALVLSLVEEAIKVTPTLIADLQDIFNKPNPTPADWESIRQKVHLKSYKDFVVQTELPL